jgi:hypothetical protein
VQEATIQMAASLLAQVVLIGFYPFRLVVMYRLKQMARLN